MSEILRRGATGYAIHLERRNELEAKGIEASVMMRTYKDQFPQNNPTAFPSIIPIMDQGRQGSCQGQSLSKMFQICYFLATGRIVEFSAACGYYLAQKKDGLIGDVGSTLSGGRWVATEHGMCLESDWPYTGDNYNPSPPSGIDYPFKLSVSRPMNDADTVFEWLGLGLPIQIGIIWDSSCDLEVVDNYIGFGGGGHATSLWTLTESGNARNINSWSEDWNGDGIHEFTRRAVERMVGNRNNVFIGYAPDNMLYPIPPIIDPRSI